MERKTRRSFYDCEEINWKEKNLENSIRGSLFQKLRLFVEKSDAQDLGPTATTDSAPLGEAKSAYIFWEKPKQHGWNFRGHRWFFPVPLLLSSFRKPQTMFLAQGHTETFPKPNPICTGTSLLSLFLMCVHLCKCVCMFKCVHLCIGQCMPGCVYSNACVCRGERTTLLSFLKHMHVAFRECVSQLPGACQRGEARDQLVWFLS